MQNAILTAKSGNKAKPIEVKTLFGRHYVDPADNVWVKLNGEFARKKALHIAPGDEILIRKDGIPSITLEQIGEALAKSPSYQEKASALFVKFQGATLPVFQHSLLSGIFETAGAWPDVIVNDVSFKAQFQAGKSFELSCEQLDAAANFIQAKLVSSGMAKPVSVYNIHYNWLKGNVIRPNDFKQVISALQEIAPGIAKLSDESVQNAYRGYLAARIGIMRAVSGMLKASTIPSVDEVTGIRLIQQRSKLPKISIKPEIAEVIRLFANDITPNMLSSPVISVGSQNEATLPAPVIGRQKSTMVAGDGNFSLFKGIVTESIDDLSIKKRKPSDLAYEYNAIEGAALGIVGNLMKDNAGFLRTKISQEQFGNMLVFVKYELSEFLGYREFHLPSIMKRLNDERIFDKRYVNFPIPGSNSESAAIAKILGELILTGKLDEKYRLPKGSLKSFFEYESKLRTFLPTDLILCLTLEEIINFKTKQAAGGKQAVSIKNEERLLRSLTKPREMSLAFAEMKKRSNADGVRKMLNSAKLHGIAKLPDHFFGFFSVHEKR